MKKRAFTLAELMGVIVLLGIIALLSVPVVDKILKENTNNLYRMQIVNIEQGAANWITDHPLMAPKEEGETMRLSLYQLIHGGFVDQDITDPKKKTLFPQDMTIDITRKNNNYQYHVNEDTGTMTNDTKYNPNTPVLDLNGDALVYIGTNEGYSDLKAIAKSATGADLTDSIVIDETGLNLKQPGTYYVTYTIVDHGALATAIRTIIVTANGSALDTILKNDALVAGATTGLHLESDHFGNSIYRYKSINQTEQPKNYVKIEDNLYRIISISQDGTLKVMKDTFLETRPFDNPATRFNTDNTYCMQDNAVQTNGCHLWGAVTGTYATAYGGGVNTYVGTVTSDSALKTYLNSTYYNSLSDHFKNIITIGTFYFGSYDHTIPNDFNQIYNYSVKNNIGLLNNEEYYQASTTKNCNPWNPNTACANWMVSSAGNYWTLNGYAENRSSAGMVGQFLSSNTASTNAGVRPVFYLKATVEISGGTGTMADPYLIS